MSPLGVFFQEKVIFVFSQKGNIIFAIFIFIYKKRTYFYALFEKDHLSFPISYFQEKNAVFLDITNE